MPTLTIISGLPGSGKSTYIQNKKHNFSGIAIEDYYKKSISGPPERKSRHYDDLIKSLKNNENSIIADIVFCKKNERERIIKKLREQLPKLEIKWISFENNLDKCIKNIDRRGRKRINKEKEKAKELSKEFSHPEEAEIKEVRSSD